RIVHEHASTRQGVQQRRFPGVGVTGYRDGGNPPARPPAALYLAPGRHLGDLAAELGGPCPDPAPVRLDLGLAGAAGAHAAPPRAARAPPPASPATRPTPSGGAAGTAAAPVPPAPCRPCCARAGRRCRG